MYKLMQAIHELTLDYMDGETINKNDFDGITENIFNRINEQVTEVIIEELAIYHNTVSEEE